MKTITRIIFGIKSLKYTVALFAFLFLTTVETKAAAFVTVPKDGVDSSISIFSAEISNTSSTASLGQWDQSLWLVFPIIFSFGLALLLIFQFVKQIIMDKMIIEEN